MNAIIVGFGNMGKLHYSKLISKGIKVPIIVDLNSENINVDSIVYSTLDEVPSFENINFIFICTPTNTHFELLIKALEKNLPIFLEKPAVRTLEEINNLRKLQNKFIFVGEVELFNNEFKKYFEYKQIPSKIRIERKVDLHYFLKGDKPWFLDEKLSGGIVLDLMVHDITLLISKFGIPKIKSVEFSKNQFEINDYVKVILSFDNFESEIISSWIEKDEKYLIKVKIDITDKNNNISSILSNNYMKPNKIDAFDNQLDSFLNSINENKLPYDFNMFLDATKLCLEINNKIHDKKIIS